MTYSTGDVVHSLNGLYHLLYQWQCDLTAARLEMDPVLTFEHFDPEGKHQIKKLPLAINGRANVCLLIAPLEVQWDSFTVDGADNKP